MTKADIVCGYLGLRVAGLWRERKVRVWATTRSAEGAAALRKQGLEPVVCDVLKPETLGALPAADTVL